MTHHEPLNFLAHLWTEAQFFIPDGGEADTVAYLAGPATQTKITESELTSDGRIGIQLPMFEDEGDYVLQIDHGDDTYVYEIVVIDPQDHYAEAFSGLFGKRFFHYGDFKYLKGE